MGIDLDPDKGTDPGRFSLTLQKAAFFDIFINFKRINVWILMKEIRCIQVADIYE